jgi:hypothetical protein
MDFSPRPPLDMGLPKPQAYLPSFFQNVGVEEPPKILLMGDQNNPAMGLFQEIARIREESPHEQKIKLLRGMIV